MQELDALAMLGMRDSLTIDVLLDVATALEGESAADETARNRSTALLHQLDRLAQGTAQLLLKRLIGTSLDSLSNSQHHVQLTLDERENLYVHSISQKQMAVSD